MTHGSSNPCPVCGESPSARARFCTRCGARLESPSVLARDPVELKPPENPAETGAPPG